MRAHRQKNKLRSFARFPLAEALKTISLERLREIETIDPTRFPPWRPEAISKIEIGPDRGVAIEQAEAARSTSDIIVYSDSSGRQGHLGAAATTLNDGIGTAEYLQIRVGPIERWSVTPPSSLEFYILSTLSIRSPSGGRHQQAYAPELRPFSATVCRLYKPSKIQKPSQVN